MRAFDRSSILVFAGVVAVALTVVTGANAQPAPAPAPAPAAAPALPSPPSPPSSPSLQGRSGAGAGQAAAPAPGSQRLVVPLSDPSRPGTLKVRVIQGSITVVVGSSRDIIVNASGERRGRDRDRDREPARDRNRPNRPSGDDGLRRLNQPFGVDIEEEANVVTVSTAPQMSGTLTIEVPKRTNLQVSAINGGGISIDGVDGDIEANNVNGSVTLNDVSGSVVAHSLNGEVRATISRIGSSPMAFTSMNGEIDVTLPAAVKANLKMRSDHGDVLTDFEIKTTPPPARTETNRQAPGREPDARRDNRRRERDDRDARDGVQRLEVDRAIYGTVNGGGVEIELRTYNGDVRLRKAK